MTFPVRITFRNLRPVPELEAKIREKASALARISDELTECRVLVEARHRHQHKGRLFHVRLELPSARGDIVVTREPHENHAHEDPHVAVRDAFLAARKQLAKLEDRRPTAERMLARV